MNVSPATRDPLRLAPLAALPAERLRALRFLLFDVDETFTTHGLITPSAFAALHRLREGGIEPIPVTGRPAGWGHMMLSTWPIRACVTENGGVYGWRHPTDGRIEQRILHAEYRGPGYRETLLRLGETILAAHPEVRLSADQPWRLTDLAIDYAETVPTAPPTTVAAIVAAIERAGCDVAVSSIHIHALRPRNDKRDGVLALMQAAFGLSAEDLPLRCAFIGDSANDASLFAALPLSVGVANIDVALDRLPTPPAYRTTQERGAGFVEFVDRLLAAREAPA